MCQSDGRGGNDGREEEEAGQREKGNRGKGKRRRGGEGRSEIVKNQGGRGIGRGRKRERRWKGWTLTLIQMFLRRAPPPPWSCKTNGGEESVKGKEKLVVETSHRLGTDDADSNYGVDKPYTRVGWKRVVNEMLMPGMYFDENNSRTDVDENLTCGMMGSGG